MSVEMKLPNGVLVYHVLKSTDISEENKKLAWATITALIYKSEQLKKLFGDMSRSH